MGPELLDPDQFGFKDALPTKKSDCYALGMVMYEVLSGKAPFTPDGVIIVMRKVTSGGRPERPQGVEGVWFTDSVWDTLQMCWAHKPEERPTVETVLERLKWGSVSSPDDSVDDPPREIMSHGSSPSTFSLSPDLTPPPTRKRQRSGSGLGITPSPDPPQTSYKLVEKAALPAVHDSPRAAASQGFTFSTSTPVTPPPTSGKRLRSGPMRIAGLEASAIRDLINCACHISLFSFGYDISRALCAR